MGPREDQGQGLRLAPLSTYSIPGLAAGAWHPCRGVPRSTCAGGTGGKRVTALTGPSVLLHSTCLDPPMWWSVCCLPSLLGCGLWGERLPALFVLTHQGLAWGPAQSVLLSQRERDWGCVREGRPGEGRGHRSSRTGELGGQAPSHPLAHRLMGVLGRAHFFGGVSDL